MSMETGCCRLSPQESFPEWSRSKSASLKLEYVPQEEYEREKIQWTFIEFPDNKDCIELIDRKPNGIIPTLDEQVRRSRFMGPRLAQCFLPPLFVSPRLVLCELLSSYVVGSFYLRKRLPCCSFGLPAELSFITRIYLWK